MNVLFIVHGFAPTEHSGTFRSTAFARYLPDFGIMPIVVCASDEADVLTYGERAKEGDPIPGFVVARPDWKWKASSRGALQHTLRRFPLGWTFAQRRQYAAVQTAVMPAVREAICAHKPAVLYASSPPPAALVLAAQASRETGIPYVADLRDPWSYYSWARYRHLVDFLFERALERRVLNGAATVIANTPTARQLLVAELRLPEQRVLVLMNGYDEADFADVPLTPSQPRDVFEIVYTGILSAGSMRESDFRQRLKKKIGLDYSPLQQDPATRGPAFFLQAASEVLQRRPEFRSCLHLCFVGSFGPDIVRQFSAFPFPDALKVMPPASKREAVRIVARADMCLLLQIEMKLRGRDCGTSVPGKLFDYLRAGIPILAPMQRSDATELIEKLGAGTVVPPRDVKAIAKAIETALDEWKARGRTPRRLNIQGIEQFDRRRLTGQLADILRRAAASSS